MNNPFFVINHPEDYNGAVHDIFNALYNDVASGEAKIPAHGIVLCHTVDFLAPTKAKLALVLRSQFDEKPTAPLPYMQPLFTQALKEFGTVILGAEPGDEDVQNATTKDYFAAAAQNGFQKLGWASYDNTLIGHFSDRGMTDIVNHLQEMGFKDMPGTLGILTARHSSAAVLGLLKRDLSGLEVPDGDGRTPIFLVKNKAMFDALVDAGADLTKKDKFGNGITHLYKGEYPVPGIIGQQSGLFEHAITRIVQIDPNLAAELVAPAKPDNVRAKKVRHHSPKAT